MTACELPTTDYPDGRTGTRAGYLHHLAHGERPCEACRIANTTDAAERAGRIGLDPSTAETQAWLLALAERTERELTEHDPTDGWRRNAACRGLPTEWWFPTYGDDRARGAAICDGCAVRLDCAAETQGEAHGIWGGIDRAVRFACARPTARSPFGTTGTPSGRSAHRRAGEECCAACSSAVAAKEADRRAAETGTN